jgi:hypothetical protein
MTPAGWVFLLVSLGFVWGLAIWCFRKVFTLEDPEPRAASKSPSRKKP